MNDLVQIEVQQQLADKPLTVAEMIGQVSTIQQMLTAVMIKDTHYGVIPGTQKPSLFKPGAEKIMMTFRLAADPQMTEIINDPDVVRFRAVVRLTSPSGRFIGAGVGECSSGEEKYCWRNAICPEEFEEFPADRRREKWKSSWQNGQKRTLKIQQVRTNPADLANTILKMAKKRALVDAVLTATAASDVFVQDLEDLPTEYVESNVVDKSKHGNPTRPPAGIVDNAGKDDPGTADLMTSLTEIAQKGWDALQKEWAGLSEEKRQAVGVRFRQLKEIAQKAGGGE